MFVTADRLKRTMPDFWTLLAPSKPAAAAPPAAPADEGQIQARILGHGCQHGRFSHVTFDIQVRTPGEEISRHIVQRRYSSFLVLEDQLRRHFPHLPPTPPKSSFRKRLRPNSFMAERERLLGEFLVAALKEDPGANTPELRRFLAVGFRAQISSRSASGVSRTSSASSGAPDSYQNSSASNSFRSTNLSMISEELEEDDVLDDEADDVLDNESDGDVHDLERPAEDGSDEICASVMSLASTRAPRRLANADGAPPSDELCASVVSLMPERTPCGTFDPFVEGKARELGTPCVSFDPFVEGKARERASSCVSLAPDSTLPNLGHDDGGGPSAEHAASVMSLAPERIS